MSGLTVSYSHVATSAGFFLAEKKITSKEIIAKSNFVKAENPSKKLTYYIKNPNYPDRYLNALKNDSPYNLKVPTKMLSTTFIPNANKITFHNMYKSWKKSQAK